MKLAFRLFPWRGGSLSAYRADNNAATPRKFARKLAARPTYSAQHRREIERFRPYCFPDSGGLGATANASGHFSYLLRSVSLDRHIHTPHHRPSSQVTLGSAQTRQGTLGFLDSPSAAASSTERRSALNRRRKPRPSRLPRLFRSVSLDRHIHTPHHRPLSQVTLGSAQTRQGTLGSLDSPSAAASSTERRSALNRRRKPLPQRRSAVASHLVLTRNAPQRSARRPPARRPRRINAAAVGCRLSLPTCRRRSWRRWRSGGSRWGRES